MWRINAVCAVVSGVFALGFLQAGAPMSSVLWNTGACLANIVAVYIGTRKDDSEDNGR